METMVVYNLKTAANEIWMKSDLGQLLIVFVYILISINIYKYICLHTAEDCLR